MSVEQETEAARMRRRDGPEVATRHRPDARAALLGLAREKCLLCESGWAAASPLLLGSDGGLGAVRIVDYHS